MSAGLRYVLNVAATLLVVGGPVAVPAQADVSAFGVGALKAEWLAGYNGGPGIDVNGLFDLDLVGKSNVKLYRARFRQDQVLVNGTYSQWTMLDNLVKQAALEDVTLQAVLINMPGEQYTPPTTDAARASFADFAAAAARRYGPSGNFWSGCGCPAHPVEVWEVWNEPNVSGFWNPPSPHDYALLLQAVRSKLREVDPEARIMFGGLAYPSRPNGTTSLEPNGFLQSVIATVGPSGFDALAVHSYHASASAGVSAIGATVATLKTYAGTAASGAPRQQVWVNEFGTPTTADDPATTSVNEQQTSEAAQRDWLNAFLDGLLPNRAAWNLGPVFWYSLRDAANPTAAWQRLGLRRTQADDSDGGPKPAWTAYTERSAPATALTLPTLLAATPSAPVVTTDAATSIAATSATLNGAINPENQPTTYHFEYGTSTGYDSKTAPDQPVSPTDYASHPVTASVSGLIPGTTYHYRLAAVNATGTTYGDARTFTATSRSYRDTVLVTTGLTSYWRLGEHSGTAAVDETGSSPGSYHGGYILGGPGALAGDLDSSVAFDGTSGEMTPAGPALASSGSLEGWFNWQGGVALMRDGTSTGSTGWILAYDSGGRLHYRLGGTSFNTGRATSSVKNGWHHFVATKNAGNVAFYIDGQLAHSGTGATSTAPTMPWHVMRNGRYAQFTRGSADEVAVYDGALSAATVRQHYNAGRR